MSIFNYKPGFSKWHSSLWKVEGAIRIDISINIFGHKANQDNMGFVLTTIFPVAQIGLVQAIAANSEIKDFYICIIPFHNCLPCLIIPYVITVGK